MAHAYIPLRALPNVYRELTFLSYHVTEHRDQHDQPTMYITVSGIHPDHDFVTIVQGTDYADIISEHTISAGCEAEWEKIERVEVMCDKVDSEHRGCSTTTSRTEIYYEWKVMEAEAAVALEVAFDLASKAGVIRPVVRSAVWAERPSCSRGLLGARQMTQAELDVLWERDREDLLAYQNGKFSNV